MIQFFTLQILKFFDYFYQKRFINFLKSKGINKLSVFFDIGAHKGESIDLFCGNFEVDKMYSFEASSITFNILKVKAEKLRKKFKKTKIFLENLALGSLNKKISIKHISESSSSTIREINKNSKYYKKKFFFLKKSNENSLYKEVEVEQILLSDYVQKNNIEVIDFIKIDTEGYELEVLRGAENVLKKTRYILFEHHYDDMIMKNYYFSDIHGFLKKNNFKKIYKSKMPFRKTFEYIYVNHEF